MAEQTDAKIKKNTRTIGVKIIVFTLFGAALYEIYSRTPMFEKLKGYINEI